MLGIIDYGVGNLFSLRSSFSFIGQSAEMVSDPGRLPRYDHLVLPGVGAFTDAAQKLRDTGMAETLCQRARAGVPLLGICLGMQMLLDKSLEYGEHAGLKLIPGTVRSIEEVIPAGYKVPHIGWNCLLFPEDKPRHPLFTPLNDGDHAYFVHSYQAAGCDSAVIARTEYGAPITAAVARDNVCGTQFHPEKSGPVGLRILQAFCRM